MFQFGRFPSYTYLFSIWYMDLTPCGLLHSDISGSMCACHSPELFAAYRVLHRLLMPRHPPCALISLTYSRIMSCFSTEELFEIVFYPLNFFNWISLISSLLFRYSIFKEHLSLLDIWSPWVLFGGDEENRTPDPLLARQVLSQLSYTPIFNCWCLARSEGKFLQNWTIQI